MHAADGTRAPAHSPNDVERVKKDRIQTYAIREYDLSPAGEAVLDRWLSERATHEYIAKGLHISIYSRVPKTTWR